jgi:AAA15 family ATPase/GTPase
MREKQQAYISHAHLKGYKSIRDLEVDLKPGLNIIIGPNGSGKTSFQRFTNDIIWEKFEKIESSSFEYKYTILNKLRNGQSLSKHIISKEETGTTFQKKEITSLFSIGDIEVKEITYSVSRGALSFTGEKILTQQKVPFYDFSIFTKLIQYKDPPENLLANPISLQFNNVKEVATFSFNASPESDSIISLLDTAVLLDNSIVLQERIKIDENVKLLLKKYTLIQDVRIDSQLFRIHTKNGMKLIENIIPEFFVNNEWFSFNSLSDGTQRLFYIITSVRFENETILFEEPELGIHPDQLAKLMTFLKEQSKEKQIILTTHSPEVLNILNENELDRIIVTRYDSEKGTQMHKLSPTQIAKGQLYMKEVGHLSDYWVHSNLEEYEIEQD